MVHTKVSRLLIACAIVAILALGFVFFSSNRFFLSQQVGDIGSDTVSEFKDTTRGSKNEVDQALLIPLVAEVAVNTSGEWQLVSEPTSISQGVGVKTDATGQAKIIFADGSVLSLDSSTQITLDLLEYKINGASDVDSANGAGSAHQRVKVFQVIGKTWSQVEKLLSPLSSYEIETQTTVATVRGTAFGILVDAVQAVDCVVGEGEVVARLLDSETAEMATAAPLVDVVVTPDRVIHWSKPDSATAKTKPPVTTPKAIDQVPVVKAWMEGQKKSMLEYQPIVKKVKRLEWNPNTLKFKNTVKAILSSPSPLPSTTYSVTSPTASPLLFKPVLLKTDPIPNIASPSPSPLSSSTSQTLDTTLLNTTFTTQLLLASPTPSPLPSPSPVYLYQPNYTFFPQ